MGERERIVNYWWIAQGGCTLSLPASTRARGQITNQSAPNRARSDNNKVDRNQNSRKFCALVDGIGGERFNNLQRRVFIGCRSGTGRQAQLYPQNWVGWCPGSLLTNLSDPHPRAGLERPTSAEEFTFEMRSRLDHPRSHQCGCEHRPADWARLSSKPGSHRCDRKFSRINVTIAGSILAQERYSQRLSILSW